MSLCKHKPTLIQEQVLEDNDDDFLTPPPLRKRANTRRTAVAARSQREDFSAPDKAEAEEVSYEVDAGTTAQ
jgi:hypothetical protein